MDSEQEKIAVPNVNKLRKTNDILLDKVSITWDMLRKCNHRCPHCWFEGKWEEEERYTLYMSANRWIDIWNRIYENHDKVNIIICGGEPFIYPSFIDIVKGISAKHRIEIITNGSCVSNEFIDKVGPNNVSLSLSFYPYLINPLEFIDTVKVLKKNNFAVSITYIAYPPQFNFEEIKSYRYEFKTLGCGKFNLISYWGKYKNCSYPDAYTEAEKKIMIEYSDTPEQFILSCKIEHSKGRLCWAGARYAAINPRGEVARCGSSGVVIGNISDDKFRLFENPERCPVDFCKCSEYKPVE